MTESIVERLWPMAYAEASKQINELQKMCRYPVWRPEEVVSAYKIFHTMKSTMAMVQVGALERLFHACEKVLSAASDSAIPVNSDTIKLLGETVERAAFWLDCAYHDRSIPEDDIQLLERIGALEGA